ncbi:MAG: prepilin-type N-terminal cleavage/methylation domain-containing protein [Phycisphaeraceae bacterium]|nr:prepilin-type N-terminal cleavage/methylation domain-containing protein [Phycisphaeraceae bacterium]
MSTRAGFSLIELITVLAVVVLLTGLLLPALTHVRESVNRVLSASNLRQIGLGVTMYDRDYNVLPYSRELRFHRPHELMAAWAGTQTGWDGLGRLWSGHYVSSPEVFYSPSHRGLHPFARYTSEWMSPTGARIYMNYHYGGDVDWLQVSRRRSLASGIEILLATDGLRTRSDFNHRVGMNQLRGDGSVRWREDNSIYDSLPIDISVHAPPPADLESIVRAFRTIESGPED